MNLSRTRSCTSAEPTKDFSSLVPVLPVHELGDLVVAKVGHVFIILRAGPCCCRIYSDLIAGFANDIFVVAEVLGHFLGFIHFFVIVGINNDTEERHAIAFIVFRPVASGKCFPDHFFGDTFQLAGLLRIAQFEQEEVIFLPLV